MKKKELQFSKVYWKETYEFWICSSKQIPSYQVKNDTVQVSFSHDIHLLAYWIEKKTFAYVVLNVDVYHFDYILWSIFSDFI
jgi:hypothetical protein